MKRLHTPSALRPLAMMLMLVVIFVFIAAAAAPVQAGKSLDIVPTSTPTSRLSFPPFFPTKQPTEIQSSNPLGVNWLTTPPDDSYLASSRQLNLLAGQLIFHGLVDASSCPDGGLLNMTTKAASPCGERVAHNAVILWQNQFDQAIYEAAQQQSIPPYLLKNVIAQESQFWPGSQGTKHGYSEYGLGHMTTMGADTLLRWNSAFFRAFCPQVYSEEGCKTAYALMPLDQQALLRGAIIQRVNADCGSCPGGIDLQRARESIIYIAAAVRASQNSASFYITGLTGRSMDRLDPSDAWKITLIAYHSGPGCLSSAISRAKADHLQPNWQGVSDSLEKACESAVPYVKSVKDVNLATPQELAAAQYDTSKASRLVLAGLGYSAPPVRVTDTPQPTVAPTDTTTATPASTPTGTVDPGSETPAPTSTLDPALTPTATSTPDPSITATPTPTIDPSATLTATAGIEATPTVTETPSPAWTLPPFQTETPEPSTPTPAAEEFPTATPTLLPTDFPWPTFTATPDIQVTPPVPPQGPSTEIIVKFFGIVPNFIAQQVIDSVGGQVQGELSTSEPNVVLVPENQLGQILSDLNDNLLVEYAEPNHSLDIFYIPNDPGFVNQTNLSDMQVPLAWEVTRGAGVIVAVIDTGVDFTHPDLISNLWVNPGEVGADRNGNDKSANGIDDDNDGFVDDVFGWNFVENNNDFTDYNGHGTHIAGIIAATMDNNFGISGIAPEARIMSLKALDSNGHGNYANVAQAILYAVDHGAKVINLGFGGIYDSDALRDATNYAYERGVVVVAAAGNGGNNTPYYPAANPNVIAALAVDSSYNLTAFSSNGYVYSVAAPGLNILSTLPNGNFGVMSGTSMASAEVSGIAALLATQGKMDTVDKIRYAIFGSAYDLGEAGHDLTFGYGLIQALNAFAYDPAAFQTPTPAPPSVATITPTPTGVSDQVTIQADAANALINNYALTCPAAQSFNQQTGTTVAINGANLLSGPIPLGFDFWYMGNRYTQIWVSSNGWISFNNPASNTCSGDADSCPVNDLDNSTNTNAAGRPYIAPLWDALGGANAAASYTTIGTAPNRTFRFEWWRWRWGSASGADAIRFRLDLTESSGVFQFWYDQGVSVLNNASASIGFTGSGNTVFRSAQSIAACPTFTTPEVTNLAVKPTDGRRWVFTPPVPPAPTNLTFSGITTTAMTLNWTDNATNENGYVIYQSTDGSNYSFYAQTPAPATNPSASGGTVTYNATGLTPGATYYWRVYAVSEGALSTTALSGAQATTVPLVVTITSPTNNSTFVQGTAITFTATAMDVTDGDISANLQWTSSLDGSIGGGASVSKSNLSLGVHTITATATNSGGFTASASITVTITDPSGNTPPVLTITAPPNNSIYTVGTNINFTGTAMDTQDGNISANIQWSSSINGSLGAGASISTSALSAGIHTITARITDLGGLTSTRTIRVYVTTPSGQLPPDLAILSPASGASVQQGTLVGFLGSASILTNGNISNYIQWSSSRDGVLATNTSSFGTTTLSVGTHTITATVTDANSGLSSTVTITITITAPPAPGLSPHGRFNGSTEICATCHRPHAATSWGPLVLYPQSPYESNNFCLSCHSTGTKIISTHSNKDAVAIEQPFELLCVQCHDPHGNPPNLKNIRSYPRLGTIPGTTFDNMTQAAGPVAFTARTGSGSFDDGTSAASSRLCLTCHQDAANPGAPMTIHSGGAGHSGGQDYTGQDCIVCHPHSQSPDPGKKDGFTTTCRACHGQPQDAGQGSPRRQIVGYPNGSGGNNNDFARASHHVAGNDTVTDADCKTCHEMSQHRQGKVRLFNQDSPSTVYILDYLKNAADDPADYENFCLSCHDSNGKAGNVTPFSDKKLIPSLNTTLWAAAQHNVVGPLFNATCLECHSNGHGSNKTKMQSRFSTAAPWDWQFTGSGVIPTDVLDQEEDFCFKCHTTGPGTNVQSAFFAYNNTATGFFKHNVMGTYQKHDSSEVFSFSFGGVNRHIECDDCHNPHTDKTGDGLAPAVKPETIGGSGVEPVYGGIGAPTRFNFLNQAVNEYQICFKCHSSYSTAATYLPDGWGCTGSPCTRTYILDGLRKLTRTANNQIQDTRDLAQAFNPSNASYHPVLALGKGTWNLGFTAGWSISSRVYCSDCHTNATPAVGASGPHGSPLLHILTGSLTGSTNYSTVSQTARNVEPTIPNTELCFKCHDYATYVSGSSATNTHFRNGGRNLHYEHMSNGRFTATTCYTCHNTHGSANNLHLINFDAAIAVPQGGRTSETAWTWNGTTGSCYVACHGKNHNPETYTP